MNVQQLIDELMKIENKSLLVCVSDWSEQHNGYILLEEGKIKHITDGIYLINGNEDIEGTEYICIDP